MQSVGAICRGQIIFSLFSEGLKITLLDKIEWGQLFHYNFPNFV